MPNKDRKGKTRMASKTKRDVSFATRLVHALVESGESLTDISAATGIPIPSLSRFRAKRTCLTMANAEKLAKYLRVKM